MDMYQEYVSQIQGYRWWKYRQDIERCEAFTFLMENIYVQFDGMVYFIMENIYLMAWYINK